MAYPERVLATGLKGKQWPEGQQWLPGKAAPEGQVEEVALPVVGCKPEEEVAVVADTMVEAGEEVAGRKALETVVVVVEGRKVEAVVEAAESGTIEVAAAGRRRVSGQSRPSVVAAAVVVAEEEEEVGIAEAEAAAAVVDIVAVVEGAFDDRLVVVAMLQHGQGCTDWAEEVCTVLVDCTAVWEVWGGRPRRDGRVLAEALGSPAEAAVVAEDKPSKKVAPEHKSVRDRVAVDDDDDDHHHHDDVLHRPSPGCGSRERFDLLLHLPHRRHLDAELEVPRDEVNLHPLPLLRCSHQRHSLRPHTSTFSQLLFESSASSSHWNWSYLLEELQQ